MKEPFHRPRDRDRQGIWPARRFDARYFSRVYGGISNGHDAAQTTLDRLRDVRISQLLRRHVPDGRRPAVLDIGCGYGYMLERLNGAFDVYAMDVSHHAALEAARRTSEAAIVCADVESGVPFSRRFDVVLAINVLEHIRSPAGVVGAIRDALVPGGVVAVHLPTINNPVNELIYGATYDRDHSHVYRPSARAVRSLFESIGFVLIDDSFCPHVPRGVWNALPWHPAYLAFFRRHEL